MKKTKRIAALILSASLALSLQSPFIFALDPEPESPPEGVDPIETPIVEEHKLEGKIFEHEYSSSESSSIASGGKTITVTLEGGDTAQITSQGDGSFSFIIPEGKNTASGKYAWKFNGNDTYLAASGNLSEDEESKVYLKKRYKPSSLDYRFKPTANFFSNFIKKPGIYTILPTRAGDKLAKTLGGATSNELDINIDSTGLLESFYIVRNGDYSQVLDNERVLVDNTGPKIGEVTTTAANGNTYVKVHGIYSKTKAEIVLNAVITDAGVGINKVYLISKKDDVETIYEANKRIGNPGEYTVSIPLPDEETIMDANVMYLVATDYFGHKSTEVLIAKDKAGSSVTLEGIAPTLSKIINIKPNENGWYNKIPLIGSEAEDNLSGLAEFEILQDGRSLASKVYDHKMTEKSTLLGIPVIDHESDSGSYEFKIRAKDNSGNISTDEFSLKIDLIAPIISAEGVKTGEHYNKVPDITIKSDEKYFDAEGSFINYQILRDDKPVLNKKISKTNKAIIPSGTFTEDGVYTVKINATDAAGNTSNELEYKFTKDTVAPKVKLSGVKNGKFYNKGQKVTVNVQEVNFKENEVKINVTKKRGNNISKLSFPWSNKSFSSYSSKILSEIGTYTITVQAEDKAGNKSSLKKLTFTVDTKDPVITITGVKDGEIYTYGESLSPNANVSDDYRASKSITFTKGGVGVSNPSFAQVKENDGLYTMKVTAKDKAGNSSTKEISFTVNRFGSRFEYNNAIKTINGKAFKSIEEDLVVTERNISPLKESDLQLKRDGKSVEGDMETRNLRTSPENSYQHIFRSASFEKEGMYEINVASIDTAGNQMESKDENGEVKFFVDRTEPTIMLEGASKKGIKAETAELVVSANDNLTGIKEIKTTVAGENVTLTKNDDKELILTLQKGLNQKIHISAVDGAGNVAELDTTLSVSPNRVLLLMARYGFFALGVLAILVGGAFLVLTKRRKNNAN